MSSETGGALSADELAVEAKSSESRLEELIEQSTPFMHNCVRRTCGQLDGSARDDMSSVALSGLYEAVSGYDAEKGHFYPFAELVIHRRLTDALRQLQRQRNNLVYFDDITQPESGRSYGSQSNIISSASLREHSRQSDAQQLRMEIEQFKDELAAWGISFDVLTRQSPAHKRLRQEYRAAVKSIAASREILDIIWKKKYFPISKVAEVTGLSYKKLERGRSYIIASLIIYTGGYDYLSEYISGGGG